MIIEVAVGIVRDAEQRVLIARRPSGVHLAGLWEFPGGKRRVGESRRAALVRELHEEVGITVDAARPLIRIRHDYPEQRVELDVWAVTCWRGTAHGREGQTIDWSPASALGQRRFPEADRPIIRALDLPDIYLITPQPPRGPGPARETFLTTLERCLRGGVRLVQLRAKEGAGEDLGMLLDAAASLCEQHGARLLSNVPPGVAVPPSVHGRHLPAAELASLAGSGGRDALLPRSGLLGASCHSAEELQRAERIGADFAVLGPVRETRSHPGAAALGWERFAALTRAANFPVYALGGLGPPDRCEAWERGGQGIAAIRGIWDAV